MLVSPQMAILKREGEKYPPTHQEPQVIVVPDSNRCKCEDQVDGDFDVKWLMTMASIVHVRCYWMSSPQGWCRIC